MAKGIWTELPPRKRLEKDEEELIMRGNELVKEYNGGDDRVALYNCSIAGYPPTWLLIVSRRDVDSNVVRVASDSIPDFGSFTAKVTYHELAALTVFEQIVAMIAADAILSNDTNWRSRRRATNEKINQLLEQLETKL